MFYEEHPMRFAKPFNGERWVATLWMGSPDWAEWGLDKEGPSGVVWEMHLLAMYMI